MDKPEDKFVFCANDEALELFSISIDELLTSDCFDYMVYKNLGQNRQFISDAQEWNVCIEINEPTYNSLHIDLCQKLGKIARSINQVKKPTRKKKK